MGFLHDLFKYNPTASNGILAWVIAQTIKFIATLLLEKKVDFTKLVGSGGMPSAHSAMVTAVCTEIGLAEGWHSPIFGLSIIFAAIVMYDASGVRQAVGKQARILNHLVREVYLGNDFKPGRIKELLGHTPIEVFFGAILGIIVAITI